MGYLPIQYHELLRDLWGHRGFYLGNNSQDCQYANYLTRGKHARRTGDINCIFAVGACNKGRALSWVGDDLIEERYLGDIGSNVNGITMPMMLPRDTVAKAMTSINITGDFCASRILNIFEPMHKSIFCASRDISFMRFAAATSELKRNVTGVLTFEDMCLQKAHMQHDLVALINATKQRYTDKKYNRISVCIKEVTSILRAFTRMSGMDKIAIKDYSLLNFQTENLAMATGYSNQLNTVVLARAHTYACHVDLDTPARSKNPDYDVKWLNHTHSGILGEQLYDVHNKPFNFHRAITEGYKLILDSINPGKNTSDLVVSECNAIEVDIPGDITHLKLSYIVSPEPTTLKTVLDSQDLYNNYQANRFYLLGKSIDVKSLTTGEIHTLPGIPIARFNLNRDLAADDLIESMLAPINHPEISNYTLLQHCICNIYNFNSSSWSITHGNPLGIILRGMLLLELLRISYTENKFAKWLRARDNTIRTAYPYSLNSSVIPANVLVPDDDTEFGKLNLQAVLYGMCISDNFLAGKHPPDLCLLYMHLSVRFIRRLLAFALKTLRNHRNEYANDTDMQACIWMALHNILARISNYALSLSSGTDTSINLPLHAKYTIHSMLPTHIEDTITRAHVFQSHLSLMGSLATSLKTHLRPASIGVELPEVETLYSKMSNGLIPSSALEKLYTWHDTGSILDEYTGKL